METLIGGQGLGQLGVTRAWSLGDLFAVPAEDAEAALAALVHEALDLTPVPEATRVQPVDYAMGSPATGALLRVVGDSTDGSALGTVLQGAPARPALADAADAA